MTILILQAREEKLFVDWEKGVVVLLKANEAVCRSYFAIKT